jgi:hypothetical protein
MLAQAIERAQRVAPPLFVALAWVAHAGRA